MKVNDAISAAKEKFSSTVGNMEVRSILAWYGRIVVYSSVAFIGIVVAASLLFLLVMCLAALPLWGIVLLFIVFTGGLAFHFTSNPFIDDLF
jgi:hypothetical protein